MGTIKVREGMFGKTLGQALQIAKPGDRIQLDPGHYVVDSFSIFDLTLQGMGEPSEVVLETKVDITGRAAFESLTLRAPHFSNAVHMPNAGTAATFTRCLIHPDPTGKYPALFARDAALHLADCEVLGGDGIKDLMVEGGARLTATRSRLGKVLARASTVELGDVAAESITALQRSRVKAGALTLTPRPQKRSLNVQGESTLHVDVLHAPNGPWEGYCYEAVVEVGQAQVPAGEQYVVLTKGAALVNSDSPVVTSRDVDAPPPPRELHWPLSSARSFGRDVLPQANRGDTILLDEGDYYLDEFENSFEFRLHLRGRGSGRTVLHGCLTLAEDSEGSITGLTVRSRPTSNAVQVKPGATLALEDVLIEQVADLEVPAVYLGKGSCATFTDCRLQIVDGQRSHVDVDGARLDAHRSELGWLIATQASTVTLDDCDARVLQALRGSEVTGDLTLHPNTPAMRQVVAESGASIRLGRVDSALESMEMASLAAELRIEQLTTPPGASTYVLREQGGTAQVHGRSVEHLGEETSAAPATRAPANPFSDPDPAGSHDRQAAPAPDGTGAASDDGTTTSSSPAGATQPPSSDGATQPASPADTTPARSTEGSAPAPQEDPLAEIMGLTGLATVKEQIEGFTQMVRFNQIRARKGLRTSEISMHSLFLGNPGTGKTTVARMLGRVLHQVGAIRSDTFVEVGRKDLVSDRIGGSAKKTIDVLDSARGGVLFIDEAYSLHQEQNNEFAQEAVDALITYMEDHRDDVVIIFAGYTDRMQDFLRMNPGLQSRVPNRFDFEDYSAHEIAEIGYRDLLDGDYVVDEDRYRRTVTSLYGRSADRSNGRWVRNLNESLVKQMVRRVMSAPDSTDEDLTRIADADLIAIGGGSGERDEQIVEELLAQLEGMVGLEPVKTWVRSLVNRVAMDRQLLELDGSAQRPSYHMVFSGNPGTGKTTVADIVAKLLHHLGVLSQPHVTVVERSTLVGRWIGHTEQLTAAAVDEAMGGVLFVDEAYQLTLEGSSNDFGSLAVETLMTRLENDRDRFVAIFAGYTDKMDEFLNANPGLRSRIPLVIEFPDFTPQEVGRIVSLTLAKRWDIDGELVEQVAAEAYEELPAKERSNGRWARNFAEHLESLHSDHVAAHGITGDAVRRIDPEVIRAAGGQR
ncbi:MAG TPA: AAA family ATPase [Candidatus Brachybacterium merdigallinarum]|nr:AAA family ATPase [Candidatus Brachybacterium merdigallinarum]